MDVSVSKTIDQKTYLKKFKGGVQPPCPPWIRLCANNIQFVIPITATIHRFHFIA